METIIIGQGYNLAENTSVAEELINLFQSQRYKSFTCLVAFASYPGVSALREEILASKASGVKIKIILGIDQKGTSKEALDEVFSWGVDASIYHTQDFNIFHPKIYLFENEDIFALIVGSNNLTIPGLVQNVECSLMIKDIRSNPVLKKFYDYWGRILDGTEVNLYPLTQEFINDLYQDKLIPLQIENPENKTKDTDTPGNKSEIRCNFRKKGLQSLPAGFTPKRQVRLIVDSDSRESKTTHLEESHTIGSEILIAEIGGGPRWKQVNFPVDIFQNFFGATRGDNNYRITLLNISQNGMIGEVKSSQAVSVKSNNFRFEISCTETNGPYPGKRNRPIGLYIKLDSSEFLYQVLMPTHPAYQKIRGYLVLEAKPRRKNELRRVIASVEAIHALYPELII